MAHSDPNDANYVFRLRREIMQRTCNQRKTKQSNTTNDDDGGEVSEFDSVLIRTIIYRWISGCHPIVSCANIIELCWQTKPPSPPPAHNSTGSIHCGRQRFSCCLFRREDSIKMHAYDVRAHCTSRVYGTEIVIAFGKFIPKLAIPN